MNRDNTYFTGLARSWRIPAFVLFAVGLHVIVETLVKRGHLRGHLILLSFFLSPVIVSTLARRQKALIGAAINGTYVLLSFSAYNWAFPLRLTNRGLGEFLLAITFGLICGACTATFQERLCKRLTND